MATVICTNCGAANDIENGRRECAFCGSLLKPQSASQTQTEAKKTNAEKKDILVGKVEITADDAIEKAKEVMLHNLKSLIMNYEVDEDDDDEVDEDDDDVDDYNYEKYDRPNGYWEVAYPIKDTFKQFSFRAELYYIPVYLYCGDYEDGKTNIVERYSFIIFAGGETSAPDSLIRYIDYTSFDSSKLSYEHECMNSQLKKAALFKNDPKELWYSVKGRKMREYLIDYDSPDSVNRVNLPVFLVTVSVGKFSEEIIIDGNGNCLTSYSDIQPIDILAKHNLGKDYRDILSEKYNENSDEVEMEEIHFGGDNEKLSDMYDVVNKRHLKAAWSYPSAYVKLTSLLNKCSELESSINGQEKDNMLYEITKQEREVLSYIAETKQMMVEYESKWKQWRNKCIVIISIIIGLPLIILVIMIAIMDVL